MTSKSTLHEYTNPVAIVSGSATIVSGYARLYDPVGNAVAAYKSQPNLMNGEWQWNFRFPILQSAGNPDGEFSRFIDDGTNYYRFVQLNDNDDTIPNQLQRVPGPVMVIRTYNNINDTSWHTVRITRYNGNFQIWIDGVSKGTGTDTFVTSNTRFY